MATKAVSPGPSSKSNDVVIVHLSEERMVKSTLGEAVGQALIRENIPFSQVSMNSQDIDQSKVYIVLDDAETPILKQMDQYTFSTLSRFVTTARKLLWVTVNGLGENKLPENGLVTGFARSARFENPELMFVTLEVEQSASEPEAKAAQTVMRVLASSFNQPETARPSELELAEGQGALKIPRLLKDTRSSEWINDRVGAASLKLVPLHEDRPLRLEIATPGLLDSLHFVDDLESSNKPLLSDELEVEVRAAGVNFRDVMIALGQLKSNSPTAGEYGGIVTRVGSQHLNFHVGDRVSVWGGSTYGNSIRVKAAGACRIPEAMPFTVAASIPCAFITAYYSLIEVARLQPGQTILIHSAAGGVGQAAIKLAQNIGATVFVTVSSLQKKQLLMDNFGISEAHIFSSKLRSFKQGVLRLTEGKGVDVVLNSLSGEVLHESWACTAMFGTFVELGKTDIYRKSRLDMSKLDGTFTFASVDLFTLLHYRPQTVAAILEKVMDMFNENKLTSIEPINVMLMTDIEDAFRFIQSRKHTGKVVLDCSPGTLVKVYFHPFNYHAYELTPRKGVPKDADSAATSKRCLLCDIWRNRWPWSRDLPLDGIPWCQEYYPFI